jgi:hypothetical protein
MTAIEWEAQRVAAAFGVREWGEDVWFMHSTASHFVGSKAGLEVVWRINPEGAAIYFRVGSGEIEDCIVAWRQTRWGITPSYVHGRYNEEMARGLFCLGYEDEDVFATLHISLSAHEQLELRLEMPREFWPLKWLEEIGGG